MRPSRRIVIAATGAVFAGAVVWTAWPTSALPALATYDVAARMPDAIPSGTVIDETAPPGWSHLVIKSHPRIRADHRLHVNALTARMASWMFTAFLADVERQPPFRLRAFAIGLGTAVNGHDTIITPESTDDYPNEVGWIGRQILKTAYERQRQSVVVVQGPTFAIVDTPVWYRFEEKHRLTRFRHVLLVNPATGSLDTLMWRVDQDGTIGDPPEAVRLALNTIDDAELLVDPAEITLGVPSEAAFAVSGLPAGKRLTFTDSVRRRAGLMRFTPDAAARLEADLRRLLSNVP